MRKKILFNEDWTFVHYDGTKSSVNIPHTWNAVDGQDGGNDYYRGSCSYKKLFLKPLYDEAEEEIWIEFQGVNSSAYIEMNGQMIFHHDGGYSSFRVNVTDLLIEQNELIVSVDNSSNKTVYPQKADFTFYGGIYRDVNLLKLSKYHFDMDYYCSDLKITPIVDGKDANVRIETHNNIENGKVHVMLKDMNGATVVEGEGSDISLKIPSVHLWNGRKDPYLYTAVVQLEMDGKLSDEVSSRFGVRSFYVDPEKGFFLNGVSYPLHGVSRHQDRQNIGNAITRQMHDQDMDIICEVGANTIRLAHYQHDQYFYDLCDERGMIVWAEIPYISEHLPEARKNTISQMSELIMQNYNHPSIVVWGLSNEITISKKNHKDMLDNHYELNDLCHKMDTTRLTTLACYAMCGPFNKVAHISDLVGWNLYLGWYVPGKFLNDLWIKFFHLIYPKRPLCYAEYGAEAMTNLHNSKPHRGDHTEMYQLLYHEYMLKCFKRHPYLWATYVWNMFDFAADARDQGGEPGMNHKGLVTFDRTTKKDSFYIYKAWWSEEPFVHICGRRYVNRSEKVTKVYVCTNLSSVKLYNNGELIEEKKGDKLFVFDIKLENENCISVVSEDCQDEISICKISLPDPNYKLNKRKNKSQNWV
ncbi:MAG: glycoside hydrolase family 2 protein [Lachnotalea sp.]